MDGDDHQNRWGSTEHLLATVIDMLQIQRIENRIMQGDKKPPSFKAVKRPGGKAAAEADEAAKNAAVTRYRKGRDRKPITPEQAAVWLAKQGLNPEGEGGDGGQG